MWGAIRLLLFFLVMDLRNRDLCSREGGRGPAHQGRGGGRYVAARRCLESSDVHVSVCARECVCTYVYTYVWECEADNVCM
jgi:hypothetical protein